VAATGAGIAGGVAVAAPVAVAAGIAVADCDAVAAAPAGLSSADAYRAHGTAHAPAKIATPKARPNRRHIVSPPAGIIVEELGRRVNSY
jgi:hypothetical protein